MERDSARYGAPLRSKCPDIEMLFQKPKISRDIAQNGYCSRESYLQCSQNHRSSVTQVAVIRQILRALSSAENIALLIDLPGRSQDTKDLLSYCFRYCLSYPSSRRCHTWQFLLQLVSQFCCDTNCTLRHSLLESCNTRQRFSVILKAVVNSAAISSSNKTSRAQKEQFDWPMPLNVATQVAGKVLHCATWEKFLATLRNALRKVELNSTSRNDCVNRKIATNDCSRVFYTRQYFVQLVSQQNCETSCKRNCLV